jgi:hypothetical protein
MTKEYNTIKNGAMIVPANMLNQIMGAMDINEYAVFRPATQSKDFDKDIKDFIDQRDSFLKVIQEATTEDRIYKLSRINHGKALEAILDPASPILTEIKNGFVEISFVIKLK